MENHHHESQLTTKMGSCYLPFLGCIPAVGFLFTEKNDKIRFVAAQSIVLHAILLAVYVVVVPLMEMTRILYEIAGYVQGIFGVGFVLVGFWLLKTVQDGKVTRIMWISDWADKIAK